MNTHLQARRDPASGLIMLHGEAPCPVCEQKVHVVANDEEQRLRWICLECRTTGDAPFSTNPETAARLRVVAMA